MWPISRTHLERCLSLSAGFALLALAWVVLAASPPAQVVFTHPPTDIQNVAGIEPLGELSPFGGSHVLPRDHMHLRYVDPDTGGAHAYPVYAMADGELVMLVRVEQEYGQIAYLVTIRHSKAVTTQYDHVHELSTDIDEYLASVPDPWLQLTPEMAIVIFGELGAPAPLLLSAGEQVGVTRTYRYSWAVWVIDTHEHVWLAGHGPRRYPTFMDRVRYFNQKIKRPPYRGHKPRNTTCFIDYLDPAIRNDWFDLLMSDPKDCGRSAWDVPATLQGAWFNPAIDEAPEPPMLELEYGAFSIIPDNYQPNVLVQIGIGSGHEQFAALDPYADYPQLLHPFKVEMDLTPGAKINPDPAEVRVTTGTVCYDLRYFDELESRFFYNLLLLRMETARRLLIKYDPWPYEEPACQIMFEENPENWTATYVR